MKTPQSVDQMPVFNKPFFVNELLAAIAPDTITPRMFDDMVFESRDFDLTTMLTAMTRQIDNTGLVPNLVGSYSDPQEVMELLLTLGHTQLLKISKLDQDVQDELFSTLKGHRYATLRALVILDECQHDVIAQMMQYRQQSPLAQALRQATEFALRQLYSDPSKIASPTFDEVICFGDRMQLLQGEPHICYPKRVEEDAVVEVWQYFVMPRMQEVHLPEPFNALRASQILEKITPDKFKRCCFDDDNYDPHTPTGFIGLLGKVGGALPRLLAKQVNRNRKLRAMVMREQEMAWALYELFTK